MQNTASLTTLSINSSHLNWSELLAFSSWCFLRVWRVPNVGCYGWIKLQIETFLADCNSFFLCIAPLVLFIVVYLLFVCLFVLYCFCIILWKNAGIDGPSEEADDDWQVSDGEGWEEEHWLSVQWCRRTWWLWCTQLYTTDHTQSLMSQFLNANTSTQQGHGTACVRRVSRYITD